MRSTVLSEFRGVLPATAFALLFPVPILNFWQDGAGRAFAFAYLFIGCAFLAADSFGRMLPFDAVEPSGTAERRRLWNVKMTALGLAAGLAVASFSVAFWAISGSVNLGVPLLASLMLLPALCCIPCLTMAVRNPFVAVLFGAASLGLIKVVGCLIVRVVYGPNALAEGYMNISWDNPNLLVRLCFAGGVAYSVSLYFLGFRMFLNRAKARAA